LNLFNTSNFVLFFLPIHSNKYPQKSKNSKDLFSAINFTFSFFFSGREKEKQSKSYYRQRERREEKNKIVFGSHGTKFFRKKYLVCGCVLVSRIQVIHCDDSKCTKRTQKIHNSRIRATKGKLNFPCVLF
jgi:hypothetical protein